jgi:transposase
MTLPYTSTKRSQYIYLRSKGWSYARIAREYGVTDSVVRNAVNYKTLGSPNGFAKKKD